MAVEHDVAILLGVGTRKGDHVGSGAGMTVRFGGDVGQDGGHPLEGHGGGDPNVGATTEFATVGRGR